ncbi:MAG: PilC/PilY family type IV pilus protein, partial [Candidatus Moraniibacteriota bacterium]
MDVQTAAENSIKWQVVSTDANGNPTGVDTIPSHGTRNIIVSTNSSIKGVEFKYTNLNPNNLIASSATPVTDKLINTFTSDQVDFIRGDQSKEGSGQPFRERQAILGDIVNARPAYVKNNIDPFSKLYNLPASQGGGTTYTTYKNSKIARAEGMLFVGANDGMLHGFRESNGNEEFAFIPRSVLGKLHLLTDKNYPLFHNFYVDGPLKEADAYIDAPLLSGAAGTSLRWTNLLMGSTGAGAKAVFALDVSRPFNMQGKHVMWEVNHLSSGFGELGHVLSEIDTGVTPSGDWVGVFGNGYDSASGKASLFLVNLSTGAKIRELTTNNSTGNGLGGVRLVHNASSQVIGAYAGDLKGNVWRFDLSGNSNTDWKNGELLFTAVNASGVAQAITAAPAVFARTDGKPGYIVVVGTGRLLTNADTLLTPPPPKQSAYGLWDESPFGSVATISTIAGRSSLVESTSAVDATASGYYKVTASRAINWTTDKGWYFDFSDLPGQKNVYPVNAVSSTVLLDTIAPKAVSGSCTVDGEVRAITYVLNPYSGMCHSNFKTLDTNNDNVV